MLAASENEPECCQVWGINRDKRGLQGKDSPKGIEYPKVSLNPAPPKKTTTNCLHHSASAKLYSSVPLL